MSMLSALASHLLSDTAVSALVGARVYPERLPESTSATPNTMPLITYQLIDEPLRMSYQNNVIFRARVQVDAWGGSYKSAQNVATAVFQCLQGYSGSMNGSVVIGVIFRLTKRDVSDPNVELHRVTQDFHVNWKEIN